MFTVLENQVHTVYDGDPVNYDESGKFALTQDLNPTYTFTYSLMGWKIILTDFYMLVQCLSMEM